MSNWVDPYQRIADLELQVEKLEDQLARSVPVVVVSEEIWRELGQPKNLNEVLDALEK